MCQAVNSQDEWNSKQKRKLSKVEKKKWAEEPTFVESIDVESPARVRVSGGNACPTVLNSPTILSSVAETVGMEVGCCDGSFEGVGVSSSAVRDV